MRGWIRLHRQIQDHEMWDSEDEPFDRRSAWIDLLLLANHEDKTTLFGNQKITIKAGQKITSLVKLAERWNWSRNKVRRYLNALESVGMILRKSDNKKTLITIVNYGIYQSKEGKCETADETANETPNETASGHQVKQLADTNKNDKNDKNIKKSVYGTYKHVRLSDPEREKLIETYGDDLTEACITFLDEYIEMKGYKAKSHYLCIKKWVVSAVEERRSKEKAVKKNNWDINRPQDEYSNLISLMEGNT